MTSTLNHINELEYSDSSDQRIKAELYDGKIYFRVRDESNGNYSIPQVVQDSDILIIKNMYGGNGNDLDLSVRWQVTCADATPYDFTSAAKTAIVDGFKDIAGGAIITELEIDSSAGGQTGVNLYFTLSYDLVTGDRAAYEVAAKAFIDTVLKSNPALQSKFAAMSADAGAFRNNVYLKTDVIEPKRLYKNVPATIFDVVVVDDSADLKITITAIGNYDHWAVKLDTEDDNYYRRVRDGTFVLSNANGGVTGVNIVDGRTIHVTLFDSDYGELYTYSHVLSTDKNTAVRHNVRTNQY